MPNITFKGTRLGEAFFGSRVSSAVGRCSGFIVGVPLNLALGHLRRAVTVQCRGNTSHHALSLFPAKVYGKLESAAVADRPHAAP